MKLEPCEDGFGVLDEDGYNLMWRELYKLDSSCWHLPNDTIGEPRFCNLFIRCTVYFRSMMDGELRRGMDF